MYITLSCENLQSCDPADTEEVNLLGSRLWSNLGPRIQPRIVVAIMPISESFDAESVLLLKYK